MYQSALVEKQSATFLPPPPTFDSHSFSPLFHCCCFYHHAYSSFMNTLIVRCKTRYENANFSLSQQQHQQSNSKLKGCPLPQTLSSYRRVIQRPLHFLFSLSVSSVCRIPHCLEMWNVYSVFIRCLVCESISEFCKVLIKS